MILFGCLKQILVLEGEAFLGDPGGGSLIFGRFPKHKRKLMRTILEDSYETETSSAQKGTSVDCSNPTAL